MASLPSWPYSQSLLAAAIAEYGRPETYFDNLFWLNAEAIRPTREERLRREIWRAWDIPFYRRRWEATDFHPSQFKKLEDLAKLPAYTVDDIRDSIAQVPPYGDYQGITPGAGVTGLRMYFSGGTTGKPRPTVYTPWDRLVGSMMVARGLYMHGFRPGHVVLNAWSYGTHNAAWAWDEALWLWLGCTPLTVGTGNVTASVKQLELAKDYGAKSILTTSDYLLHLREAAAEHGFSLHDFSFEYFQSIGDVLAVTEAWGVPAYEIYAFHEVQTISAQCISRGGLHIWHDAFIVEVVDPTTGEMLPEGEIGDLVITCLYKSGSPQIRYNIKDLSRLLSGRCDCGSDSPRMDSLKGRSDTMVKLRGVNIWPEAIGSTIEDIVGRPVEYFCIAYRDVERTRDEMLVFAEGLSLLQLTSESLARQLEERHGVRLLVFSTHRGALSGLTGRGEAAKLRRFRDNRAASGMDDEVARVLNEMGDEQ